MSDKYRKKPVVIEAITVRDAVNRYSVSTADVPEWLRSACDAGTVELFIDDTVPLVAIKTLEGRMTGGPNDWIIQGVKGEIYPCKPDIFEATYEAA